MTDQERAVMQQALEALDWIGCSPEGYDQMCDDRDRAQAALRAALDAQEEHDTDCHTQSICQRSGYSIGVREQDVPEADFGNTAQEPVRWKDDEIMATAQEVGLGRVLAPICEPNPSAFVTESGYKTAELLDFAARLLTTPPARTPLTEDEIDRLIQTYSGYCRDDFASVARAVERAHGIGGNDE